MVQLSINYNKLSVTEKTKQRLHKEIMPLIKKRNPDLINIELTEDFSINWIFDRYIMNVNLK